MNPRFKDHVIVLRLEQVQDGGSETLGIFEGDATDDAVLAYIDAQAAHPSCNDVLILELVKLTRSQRSIADAARKANELPAIIDPERECLAAVLIDEDALDIVSKHLSPDDFRKGHHRVIYRCMLRLRAAGTVIDPVTLTEQLVDLGVTRRVSVHVIGELLDRAGLVANVEHYARIVRRRADARNQAAKARSESLAKAVAMMVQIRRRAKNDSDLAAMSSAALRHLGIEDDDHETEPLALAERFLTSTTH